MTQETQKQKVSQAQYDKELEQSAMWIERSEYMPKEKAWAKARQEVSEKFQVG